MANRDARSFALSDKELQDYAEDGFLVREHVFSAEEILALRQAAQHAAQAADRFATQGDTYYLDGKRFVDREHCTMQYEFGEGGSDKHEHGNGLRVVEPIHLFDTRIDNLIDDPRITVPMQTLVGGRQLSLWTGKLNLKSAQGSGFGWHQDSPYWVHDCNHVDQLPNVMLALDDQDEDNGCFRVIRGSHKKGILPGTTDGTQLGGFFTSPDQFSSSDQVAMRVAAGALIFFNPHAVHGSEPNNSARDRQALILTYQPGDQPLLKTGRIRNINAQANSQP